MYKKKYLKLTIASLAMAALVGCGDGAIPESVTIVVEDTSDEPGDGIVDISVIDTSEDPDDLVVVDAPVIVDDPIPIDDPVVDPVDGAVSISGSFSDVIPSGPIPSAAIPSEALPSIETSGVADVIRTFEIELEEQQEVPPQPDTPASAIGILAFDTSTNTLSGTVTFSGIAEGDAVNMVHLHQNVAGLNGPIIVCFNLVEGSADTFEVCPGDGELDDDMAAAFLNGGTYLNLHTDSVPSGLLRGQVLPLPFQSIRIELQPDQVIPTDTPNGTPSGPTFALTDDSAIGYFTFDTVNPLGSGGTAGGTGANDGNPEANNPVVVVNTSFDAASVEVIVGGGFAGQNSPAATPNRMILSSLDDAQVFTANIPGTPDSALQSIAALGGLLGGVYHIAATDSAGGQVRGQITPLGTQVVQIELQPEQVIPTDFPNGFAAGPTTPLTGQSALAFFTFNEFNALGSGATLSGTGDNDGNPAANNPVVIATTTFPASNFEVIVGGGFAGQNSPAPTANRIILSSSDGFNFSANGPGTAEADLQSIGALGGLMGGVYHLAATDANGGQVRGQITPRDIQVVRIELQPEQVIPTDNPNGTPEGPTTAFEGQSAVAFFTFDETNALGSGATSGGTGENDGNPEANNPVINASTSFVTHSFEVIVGGGFAGENSPAETPDRIKLFSPDNFNFSANGPGTAEADLQSIGLLGGLLNGVYHMAATNAAGQQVRGQIVPSGATVFTTSLSSPTSSAAGTGFLTSMGDSTIVANALVSDLLADGGTFTLDTGGSPVTVPLVPAADSTLSSGGPAATGGSVAAQLDGGNVMTVDGIEP